MRVMTKDRRIVVRLSEDDCAWLTAESDRIGCDNATYVRMMLKRVRAGEPAVVAPVGLNPQPGSLTYFDRHGRLQGGPRAAAMLKGQIAPVADGLHDDTEAIRAREVPLPESHVAGSEGNGELRSPEPQGVINPDTILEQRLAEFDPLETSSGAPEAVAIPLRRIARDPFNPRRR
jgi:hypothetical protein